MNSPKKMTALDTLYEEIAGYIRQARQNVIKSVNNEMIYAYWHIGRRIVEQEQTGKKRAKYGAQILVHLSKKLTSEFGEGFGLTNLKYFRKFFLNYKDRIGHEARDQFNTSLSWTHYRSLVKVQNLEARKFYEIEAAKNYWSTPELDRQIGSLLYERLAKSKDKRGLIELSKKGQVVKKPIDALKDPVVLEFLDIPESSRLVESELEEALISHLQKFLLELGKGFAFIARQKRITLDGDHFYPDLVFYHAILKCYVIIDLKAKHLTHGDLGQMQMYVNYFDREVVIKGDNPTIGLVLCAEKNDSVVKYTLGNKNNKIFARKYQFHLPSIKELKEFVKKETSEIKEIIKKGKK